ncbi:MAG: exo-alpha-sialidase [Pirellulaceae bacterium]|nr:exo-alpha-sialidase [Pirellulaceae bacterium]
MNYGLLLLILAADPAAANEPAPSDTGSLKSELIFPLDARHNHAPGIAELPGGELVVTWYRGSGERTADDVAVYVSRRKPGTDKWTDPAVIADTPGFPDCNTALFVDAERRLWLFYPTILANSWESCLTNFKVARDYAGEGLPRWDREAIIFLKPDDFAPAAEREFERQLGPLKLVLTDRQKASFDEARRKLGDKLYQRLGWQPRCKPIQLPSGRIILPLYTDTFSISLMAITDDGGKTWHASQPLLGFGNIQPTLLRRKDGTLVAYMRENGPRGCVRVCESKDDGETWGEVKCTDLPNSGSGLDGVRLASGKWLLVYNDTVRGRHQLAVSLSSDEGQTWPVTRHLEKHASGQYHYPAVIQGADGTIHCVYSYFVEGGKSMKHAAFDEAWIEAGQRSPPVDRAE